jgi:hypothetical protein
LRGQQRRRNAPHQLGQLPHSLAVEIGKHLVHRLAVGQADITGDDFGGIFAKSISGEHRASPLGIADVTWESCAWSVKTVKDNSPFTQTSIRAISGRNSPVYSSDIQDPFADVQATGAAVLNVWNARVNESLNQYDDLRIFVLVRNMSTLEFMLMESEAVRFITTEFEWKINARGNFEATDRQHNEHRFTWQPHGSQFTVIHHVPASAYRFRIKRRPGMLPEAQVLRLARFEEDWIEAVTIEPPADGSIIPLQTD